jgi:hypothetical protein
VGGYSLSLVILSRDFLAEPEVDSSLAFTQLKRMLCTNRHDNLLNVDLLMLLFFTVQCEVSHQCEAPTKLTVAPGFAGLREEAVFQNISRIGKIQMEHVSPG